MSAAATHGPQATTVRERIHGGSAAPAHARALVTRTIGPAAREETLRDVLLLSTELVTNAVLHAHVDETQTIELLASVDRGVVRVAVTDPGAATNPRVREVDVDVPGGMGLFLVEQISDRWGVEGGDGGATRVWFELAA
jgi:anti-sigma regulatory factor (Ser/Thr protein kinase)